MTRQARRSASEGVEITSDAIREWLPLIHHIARQQVMLSRSYEHDDRVQDGLLAAWRAMLSFDPVKYPDVPLSAWVSMKVKRYMLDGSLRESRNRVVYLLFAGDEDRGGTWRVLDSANDEPRTPPELRIDPIEDAFAALEAADNRARTRRVVHAEVRRVRYGADLLEWLAGRKMRDIGADHGISKSAVSLRLKAARAELRFRLAPTAVAPTPASPRRRPVADDATRLGIEPGEHAARMHDFWAWIAEQKAKVAPPTCRQL